MKRTFLVLCLVAALSLVFVGSAYANFGPHGGFATDTDSCAACHRAHTSFSTVGYKPRVGGDLLTPDQYPSALLIGNAQTMSEFCEACHGNSAPGASTNVVGGIFDAGPSGDALGAQAAGPFNGTVNSKGPGDDANGNVVGAATQLFYKTDSTFGAPLNGGGFGTAATLKNWEADPTSAYKIITSSHSMEKVGVLWGAGDAADQTISLTCTDCHDPHGSTNYRLLKDTVNGVTVGGYDAGGTPHGIVFSTETNYPTTDGGWFKGQAGQTQMAAYVPNYTSGSSQILAGDPGKSISAWCAACHQQYDITTGDSTAPGDLASKYTSINTAQGYDYGRYEDAGAVGAQVRHRHPVDISLKAGDGNLQIIPQATTLDPTIPLEQKPSFADPRDGHIGCLTCHFAHGTSATMAGWAMAKTVTTSPGKFGVARTTVAGVEPDTADIIGTDPSGAAVNGGGTPGTSALLRADNRGVCERCHNK